jgi:amidase
MKTFGDYLRLAPVSPLTELSSHAAPLGSAEPGAVVVFETLDASGGLVESEHDIIDLDGVRGSGIVNPATGPLEVSGARPGDILIVDIIELRLSGRPLTSTTAEIGPDGLAGRVARPRTWIFDVEDGVARRGRIEIPLRPMIGLIGVAPATEPVSTQLAGPHGGNLDNRRVTVGSRVYLPVQAPGALLALGDVHAAMGDGELSGCGLETSAEITLRVDLLRDKQTTWPIVETANAWYTHGSAASWSAAIDIATEQAATLLEHEWGLDPEEIPLFLSAAGDLEICQACKPSLYPIVMRLGVRKSPTAPSPFRVGSGHSFP